MVPMKFEYEEFVPHFRVTGWAGIFEGPVPFSLDTVDPNNSKKIIQTGQDWWVLVHWRQTGWLNNMIAGNWQLRVFMEQMGRGEFQLMSAPITVPHVPAEPHSYWKDLPFPVVSMNVPAGLYKVTFALTFVGPGGKPCPIAAVAEGPVIQFYDAH